MNPNRRLAIFIALLIIFVLSACSSSDKYQAQAQEYISSIQKVMQGQYEFAVYNKNQGKALVSSRDYFTSVFDLDTQIIPASEQLRLDFEQMIAGIKLLEIRKHESITPGYDPVKVYLYGDESFLLELNSGELRLVLREENQYVSFIYTVDAGVSQALISAVAN